MPPAADARVRDAIAAADRRRRGRLATRRFWRAAPVAAAAALVIAGVARVTGWPAFVPVASLVAGLLGLTVAFFVYRRRHEISDSVAAAIDEDGGFGGELRSASWFAALTGRDAWAELHLERAADRLRAADWASLYPPVRAGRARLATAAIVAATLVVALAFPDRVRGRSRDVDVTTRPGDVERTPLESGELLSPELLAQLQKVLAAADPGALTADSAAPMTAELRDFLARLRDLRDVEALKDLARALEGTKEVSAEQMRALSERARTAAEKSRSREARNALDELARKLNEAASAEQALNDEMRDSQTRRGDAEESAESGGTEQAAVQSLQESSAAAGGAGVVMMSKQNAPGSGATPGFGAGGAGGMAASPDSRTLEIEQALRQETVEADKDNAGTNVETEVRRKTEQGHATVTFTQGAAGRGDRSRAAALPAVPEARRADVQRYFVRKPPNPSNPSNK